MKAVIFLFFITFTIFSSVTSQSVRVLTTEDFASVAEGSIPALIEFYAPWCGHCKQLAPEYEIVAETFNTQTSSVIVANVDCDAHSDICSNNGVSGYPTLKWFPGNGGEVESYSGGRTADAIINFINSKTGLKLRVKKPQSKAIEIEENQFDELILGQGKFSFVEFYAPWCGHCKQLAPVWEKLAIAFKNDRHVVIAKADVATSNQALASRFGVEGFPTLIMFTPENPQGDKYEGERDLEALVSFVNEKAGTHRLSDGNLNEKAGKIEQLDDLARRFVSNEEDRQNILEETKTFAANQGKQGMIYVRYMEKMLKEGAGYVENEGNRLKKMLKEGAGYVENEGNRLKRMLSTSSGSIQADKKDDFQKRLNIVDSFKPQE